jgi:thioredoxin 1
MLAPVLDELSKGDECRVLKLNSDENKETVNKFGVTSLPTILFFKDGELKDKHVGFTTMDLLKEKINNLK